MESEKCPVCGTLCTIEGDVTRHYEPVKEKRLEPLDKVKLKEIIASIALGYLSDSQENLIVGRIYDAFGKPPLRLPENPYQYETSIQGKAFAVCYQEALDKTKDLNK